MILKNLLIFFTLLFILFTGQLLSAQEEDEEETYTISLVQTAETDKEIHEIEDQKVLAEAYQVAEGDHIWSLLRKRGLLQDNSLPRILSMLKKLNGSLSNLDLIYPGQRIIIPLKISPVEPLATARKENPPIRISPEELKDINFQNYTIKQGDSLIKIINGKYDIPMEKLHDEYLDMVKRLNPSIDNINRVYPGQMVKLPVYTQEVVRESIKPPPSRSSQKINKQEIMALGQQLNRIFTRIGEEWLQSGEHFIPLKPGGQINLKMESYPLINISNGNKVIVDLYGDLPEKMVKLIQSNWDFYEVVKLRPGSTLVSALNQILPLCGYDRIYTSGVPFELGGDIGLRLKADWIIRKSPASDPNERQLVMINLFHDQGVSIPETVIKYLHDLGIETVVFPFIDESDKSSGLMGVKPLKLDDRTALITEILKVINVPISQNVEIPVYQKQKKNFNLIIKADFLLKEQGQNCIIDLHGLDKDAISLLAEHRFKVLSLAQVTSAEQLAANLLDFLNRSYDSHPHDFKALESGDNLIQLTISGIAFRGIHDQDILITHHNLPPEIVEFLATEGYKVFIVAKEE